MVISNNIRNKVSSRVVVIPITSNANNIYPFETKIILEKKSAKVLTDQIRTIDKSRLGDRICKLTKSEINEIGKAIKVGLSIQLCKFIHKPLNIILNSIVKYWDFPSNCVNSYISP